MQTRLEGLTLHCSNSPIPARMEEFQDLKLISRLSFVPHPIFLPQALLDCHSTQFCSCLCWNILISLEMVSLGLEFSHGTALQLLCPQRGGIQSLGSSLGLDQCLLEWDWSECCRKSL